LCKSARAECPNKIKTTPYFRRGRVKKRLWERRFPRALFGGAGALAEEQGDAPQTRDAHDGVDDAAHGRGLAAENVGDEVKLKKSHEQPVDGADDGDGQRSTIKHGFHSFSAGSIRRDASRISAFVPFYARFGENPRKNRKNSLDRSFAL